MSLAAMANVSLVVMLFFVIFAILGVQVCTLVGHRAGATVLTGRHKH
jgi:hypothetical protein